MPGNAARVIEIARDLADRGAADLVVFPELTLTGYPPEDLLFHAGLRSRVEAALAKVQAASDGIGILVGYPYYAGDRDIYNAASLFLDGGTELTYFKQKLPNYAVFDEKRYFKEGQASALATIKGVKLAVTICEDIWLPEPAADAVAHGAEVILNLNASPFSIDKREMREDVLRQRADELGVPVVYVNSVGGQDELVFDGGSVVTDASGNTVVSAMPFVETTPIATLTRGDDGLAIEGTVEDYPDELQRVYDAIVLGVRDYVNKHR
ncbi:MAG: nitrilase-related carbon-nitrogen hydrolase, partial [Pseudomonadota bacterium]